MASCICLTRARVYEALENRGRAEKWYKLALSEDVRNVEAFDSLISKRLINHEEQKEILKHVSCQHRQLRDLPWLQWVFMSKVDQTNFSDSYTVEQRKPSNDFYSFADAEVVELEHPWTALAENEDLLATKANSYFNKGRYLQCYNITKRLSKKTRTTPPSSLPTRAQ
eukprot:TRINITY_DN3583_c0_g1_i1.p1 TRINITY_DN3583_c0_g1~~TRINITY_DN3583_c0_g1_i1.p1  ORF type:complete len:168 (-),score=23.16 TRINITY_DN3583_c0_g1_i1:45-548(-)